MSTPSASDAPPTAIGAALAGPLVSTQWLCDHLGSEGLVVLDATVVPAAGADGRPTFVSGLDQYLVDGHLPGAVFAELLGTFSDPDGAYPFTRPHAAQFAAAAESVGIGPGSTVIVYDAAGGQWASRLWWLLRSFGHARVAVLDGGAVAWRAEGRPVARGHVEPPSAGPFTAVEQPGFWADTRTIAEILAGERAATLLCGLPARDFSAQHIPGSLSVPAGRLLARDTNTFLPPADLRAAFADALASPDPIVAYCRSGIAATADALALAVIGRSDVAVYDGSLSEWAADPRAPLTSVA
ncbi:sulfurtransferase [Leifsonia sp. LS1]|uniref:sulfurtransferase n=1 Tax=Leifsonia sp. LS1 TaxID=2828483 RepID=UPI001CFE1067|nr:rhodanese-like domain-containing protein [Leifsonia sp. LS1]GIT80489.1 sulfurtransferase [Leifsonia sp. LS1]